LKFLRRLFGVKDDPISELEKIIEYRFNDRELIRTALSHRSSLKETGLKSNERLEFLGDAVLGLIVSAFLYRQNHEHSEGHLTQTKAALVNERVLAAVAKSFGLGNFLYLSPEEDKSGGREKPSITSDALEALIGSVYLDGGFNQAERLIKKFILDDYETTIEDENLHNYKGELLEYLQSIAEGVPHYRVVNERGPDHEKVFRISVFSNETLLGDGEGKTKKEAEQQAARMALEKINRHKR